jgi:hypothetical protein
VLYRRALAQSVSCRDELTRTKRICMASRLIELGDLTEAHLELIRGRVEAERLGDYDYLELADELIARVAL